MNVWIHAPFDNLPSEGFRKQRYWLMAEAFASAGHDVTFWTSDFNHGTKARRAVGAYALPRGLAVVQIPVRPYSQNVCLARIWSHLGYARGLRRAMFAQVARPDVVISATPTLGAAAVCNAAARRFGARFVVDIQDAWPETFYRLLPRGCRALGAVLLAPQHWTARRLYRDADLVTGVCERYRALSRRDDFYLAYHGIARTSPHAVARQGSARLVYVGNLGAGYDLATVIDVVAADATLTLDIAGRGPREAALRDQVAARGVGARVRFHGYLASEPLRALLAACDVGVIPMRDDSWVGLPYKLGDYLDAGLRVISSLHGECGALLARHRLGTVYTRSDTDSLARAIKRLKLEETDGNFEFPSELDASQIYPRYVAHVLKGYVR